MPSIPKRLRRILFPALILAVLPAAVASAADTRAELDERVLRSGIVFQEMKVAPDRQIPADLLARSRCVAVIPNVIKAAWVLGGRYGKGVLSCRSTKGEWSPPVMIMMTGGSFGLQFGASSTDVVLFFMTTDSVRSVLNNKVKLSGDMGVAAGPVGREAEAATDGAFNAQIYSYARSRGLFAGVSLSGAYLGVNYEDTRMYYGKSYSATQVLFDRKVTSVPKSTWNFLAALPKPPTQAARKPTSKGKTASKPSSSKKTVTKPASKAPATAAKAAPAAPAAGAAAAGGEASGTAAFEGEASGTAARVAGPADSGEASGTAAAGGDVFGGEASGTAAAGDDVLGGEASGTAARLAGTPDSGEASGTAAAPGAETPTVR